MAKDKSILFCTSILNLIKYFDINNKDQKTYCFSESHNPQDKKGCIFLTCAPFKYYFLL